MMRTMPETQAMTPRTVNQFTRSRRLRQPITNAKRGVSEEINVAEVVSMNCRAIAKEM